MLTDKNYEDVYSALLSPDLTISSGVGSADTPGEGTACTIAAIQLAITGVLSDQPHPCISEVIRCWVIRVQDAMPHSIRNSEEWRLAATGIAGSASTAEAEKVRLDLIISWMWERLADPAVFSSIPSSVQPAWDHMLTERSSVSAASATAAAHATRAATDAATAAAYATRAATAAAHATRAATDAATAAAHATRAATNAAACAAACAAYAARAATNAAACAATDAVAYAAHAAHAARAARAAEKFWERADPAGLLVKLVMI